MSTPTHREALKALRADALEIFDGPECPQAVRDAIEWYHSSILVALSRPEPQAGEAKLREALAELVAVKDLRERIAKLALTERITAEHLNRLNDDRERREPLAWDAARAALSAEQKGGATP